MSEGSRSAEAPGSSFAEPVVGAALLNPVALGAIAILLLNDHVLKRLWPGLVTGKLSDVAGLVFFPLLLVAVWELFARNVAAWRGPDRTALRVALAATAIGFVLVKTTTEGAALFGDALGVGQWLLVTPVSLLATGTSSAVRSAFVVADPSDLVALPALLLAWRVGIERVRTGRSPVGDRRPRRPEQ